MMNVIQKRDSSANHGTSEMHQQFKNYQNDVVSREAEDEQTHQVVQPKDQEYDNELQMPKKCLTVKSKAKTHSEDITEQNTFLSAKKESDKKVALNQNESESNISTNVSKDAVASEDSKAAPIPKKKKKNPRLDYVELDMIGCGAFGRVVKVQKKSDGSQYAMKVIEKKKVEKMNKIYQVYNERDLLTKLSHQNIIKLHNCFHDNKCLYLVTELAQKGELSYLMNKTDAKMMVKSTLQFIVAEILLALEYLHSVGVSHRDLKPENIFVNEEGHLKIGDLGSAGVSKQARDTLKMKNHKHKDGEKEQDKLNTFVGTKEYVSPEVLKGRGCSNAADMWSLGVIIFQLYTGFTPFFDADSEYFTFQNIMECKYVVPDTVPIEGRDLIEKLLILDPKERLRANQVRNHEFFDEFNFESFENSPSPLCSLYNNIKEDEKLLDSSCEIDSFMSEDHFDEEFKDSPSVQKEILYKAQQTHSKFRPAYRAYLKKSSSLGEKDLDELKVIDEVKEDSNKDEEKYEPRMGLKQPMSDISKEDLSQDNTYDSIQDPNTPTMRYPSPTFIAKKSKSEDRGSKTVVLEGCIKKITAWIIYKKRYMELSYTDDVPRLVYYTANKKNLRNEIPLTKHTKVFSTGPTKFEIADMGHSYYFKDCGGEVKVKQWVNALSKAIASISLRKMSFKGNKVLSATFC